MIRYLQHESRFVYLLTIINSPFALLQCFLKANLLLKQNVPYSQNNTLHKNQTATPQGYK